MEHTAFELCGIPVETTGLEPAKTSCLQNRRSTKLSYVPDVLFSFKKASDKVRYLSPLPPVPLKNHNRLGFRLRNSEEHCGVFYCSYMIPHLRCGVKRRATGSNRTVSSTLLSRQVPSPSGITLLSRQLPFPPYHTYCIVHTADPG